VQCHYALHDLMDWMDAEVAALGLGLHILQLHGGTVNTNEPNRDVLA
jgi:hypothetical protein